MRRANLGATQLAQQAVCEASLMGPLVIRTQQPSAVVWHPILILLLLVAYSAWADAASAEQPRPNILWFVVDDMSADFSCYGEDLIQTPHVDALAEEGVRFTRAYATSPVCSTFRSAMITGMYQTTIGAHHHRSGRGEHRVVLPDGVEPIPAIFQRAGYYTCIGSGLVGFDYRGLPVEGSRAKRLGKTDYRS